ncbi:nuclear transport factor 2 family protein [Chitinophaga sp.]|uniref:nuclear transport factor 2 family protein n=1 Tax=Chitinophaga sp. TaxID=1869181 RepID=UPI0031DAB3B4
MKNKILLLLCISLSQLTFAQKSAYVPKDKALYDTIAHMDSVMFNAFNTHDIAVLEKVFATDVEFYNDGGGVTDYATTMKNFKAMFEWNKATGLRRELVSGSLEVYPMPGFGAIEVGEHRFIHKENGKEEVAQMKFVQVWRWKDGVWQATRVISIGH